MIIEISGKKKHLSEDKKTVTAVTVGGLIVDDEDCSIEGNLPFKAYFKGVDYDSLVIGDCYEVVFDLREFRGQYTAYPTGLKRVE